MIADGQYELDCALQEEVENEEATVEEQYLWDSSPAICGTWPDDAASETFHYQRADSGAIQTIKCAYRVIVLRADGSVETASRTAEFEVKPLLLTLEFLEPEGSVFNVTTDEQTTYRVKVTAAPDGDVTDEAEITWDFGDETDAETGSEVLHTYDESAIYRITVTATLTEGGTPGTAVAHQIANATSDPQGDPNVIICLNTEQVGTTCDRPDVVVKLRAQFILDAVQSARYSAEDEPPAQWCHEGSGQELGNPTYETIGGVWYAVWHVPWFTDGSEQNRLWAWRAAYHAMPDPPWDPPPPTTYSPARFWRTSNTVVPTSTKVLKFDPDDHDGSDCVVPYSIGHHDDEHVAHYWQVHVAIAGQTVEIDTVQTAPGVYSYDCWQAMKDEDLPKGVYPFQVTAQHNPDCKDSERPSVLSIENLSVVGWVVDVPHLRINVRLEYEVCGEQAANVTASIYGPDLICWYQGSGLPTALGPQQSEWFQVPLCPYEGACGTWNIVLTGQETDAAATVHNRDLHPKYSQTRATHKWTRLADNHDIDFADDPLRPSENATTLPWASDACLIQGRAHDGTGYLYSRDVYIPYPHSNGSAQDAFQRLPRDTLFFVAGHTTTEPYGQEFVDKSATPFRASFLKPRPKQGVDPANNGGFLTYGDVQVQCFYLVDGEGHQLDLTSIEFAVFGGCHTGECGGDPPESRGIALVAKDCGAQATLGFVGVSPLGPSPVVRAFYQKLWDYWRKGYSATDALAAAKSDIYYQYHEEAPDIVAKCQNAAVF